MALRHDERVVADTRLAILMDAPVDYDMLADRVVVSDHHMTIFSFPAEILWGGRDDAPVIEMIVLADSRSRQDAHMRTHMASVADHDIVVDESECVDCYILPDFRIRVYKRQWTDIAHDI
jgi:hypothetical protein